MKKIVVFLTAVLASASMMGQTLEDEIAWKTQADSLSALEMQTDTVSVLKNYIGRDNWFIGAQIGANYPFSENSRFGKFFDMTKPSFSIQIGKYFSPSVGMRLNLAYYRQASRANSEAIETYPEIYGSGNYSYNIFGAYIDGLFNFNNIFSQYKEDRRFNVIGIIGIGYNQAFGFQDKVEDWDFAAGEGAAPYSVNTDPKAYIALHGGVQLSYMISQAVDINLEALVNVTDDKYNGVQHNGKWDSFINVGIGVTYHFKDHYGSRRFRYAHLDDQDIIDEFTKEIEQASEIPAVEPEYVVEVQQEVVENEVLDLTVSFTINKYNITDTQKKNVAVAAKYLEDHPNVNLVITGYADVQTASPDYNLKLSERRANAVYDMLVDEFNVDSSRIRVDYKGDTVQPYEEKNEWNRVVIFIAEPQEKE